MNSSEYFRRKAKKPRQVRDAEATQAQILDAAEQEFARYGLAGTRIDAIAARTGVVKAMIYYYFESKERLYQAVMERIGSELDTAFQQLGSDHLPVEEALKAYIRSGIAYGANYPHRGMLWFYEAIQNQGQYGQMSGWQKSFWSMATLLERGIAEGVFRSLDPFLTTINILGVCTFYFNAHENLKYLDPSRQLLSSEMIERQTQEAINLILAGVKA
ncbi:TetR/AcrR family transcriptional regulator [Chlorogloeopsis sp. ULAP01]|uniref:TetR/AcrR family transcriptional regulator n=1 Tax=Chlorogloeopsis sp. ULAP01 TaxID=3056483 RepID=UPI0025AABB99|nr:TetR/AcrR family transcriptional regulator [Chlorogloeopsis sp. ULAP01]MDM9385111.1 TetR/AcrR family transcriptional regulator [Chlorogloeopsis sp. ULAP01]